MTVALVAAGRIGITARAMTDADLPFTAALYASTREQELARTNWPDDERRRFLDQQHAAQHHHYSTHYPGIDMLILEQGGAAIGRLYLVEWPDEYRVVDIAVAAPARGRGIGRAVIEDVQRAAEARGKGVSIHVEKQNPARRLYERLGFVLAEDKGLYDLLKWRAAAGDQ